MKCPSDDTSNAMRISAIFNHCDSSLLVDQASARVATTGERNKARAQNAQHLTVIKSDESSANIDVHCRHSPFYTSFQFDFCVIINHVSLRVSIQDLSVC
jgi:hypothetical protein